MSKKPVIGISLDAEYNGGYSKMPWYALRQNYCDVFVKAGAIPLPLGHYPELVDDYVEQIDGLVLTGGNFDVDPKLFGAEAIHDTVKLKPTRTTFELLIAKKMYDLGKPLLGICGGMQLINVVFGGTLIQHIPAEVEGCIPHEQPNPENAAHSISIYQGSLLEKIVGSTETQVNTAHHQAVKDVASILKVNAVAEDGIIEGVESIEPSRFILGLQWHPEYTVTNADIKIIDAFVAAAK